MATMFKTLLNSDVTTTRTLLHEAIPITGSIVSGTYADSNIKNYGHGMFQSVYDYPYLSSSSNHIFDITVGLSTNSPLSGTSAKHSQMSKKVNIYNQMAQVLVGHETDGTIKEFDEDGDFVAGGKKLTSCYFMNFSRLLTKDEIKKGSFSLTLGVNSGSNYPFHIFGGGNNVMVINDAHAATDFRVNSPAGEYSILKIVSGAPATIITNSASCGLLYYQTGIAVLTSSIFQITGSSSKLGKTSEDIDMDWTVGTYTDGLPSVFVPVTSSFSGSTIQINADRLRRRIQDIQFNNTTELNSTIYFCRANHNDYNYSANPTYLSNSKLVVKNTSTDMPVSYITGIGLYSADNELLAVAKLSEPIKKDPTTELTFRVRLDY